MKGFLFLLLGDPFLCEEKRKGIVAALEKEFGRDLSLTLLRAGEIPLSELLAQARTLPFLAPAQVFVIQMADRFTKNDFDLWKKYFESPHPQSFFILEAESLGKGLPFLDWAGAAGQLYLLERESSRITADFIRRKLQQAGKTIAADALHLLESQVGEALIFLDSFLEQLILYAGEKKEIDRSAVEALEEKLLHFEGFDLLEALAGRNLAQSLEILNDLLEASARDFPSLLGLLHWQLRRFWQAKQGLSEGASEREVVSQLRLSPNRAASFFKQLGRFSMQELEEMIERLFELDWAFKTGRAQGRGEVERWLVQALGAKGPK